MELLPSLEAQNPKRTKANNAGRPATDQIQFPTGMPIQLWCNYSWKRDMPECLLLKFAYNSPRGNGPHLDE
ncbi:hypothetical protein Ddc_13609 [Ditylenchus destructor]|nr:hypothetical protein Ddc_13609 [Ditylenchus destructor]